LHQSDPIGTELRDDLCGKTWENGNVERNFIVEKADPAPNGGAIVLGRGKHKTDTRGGIKRF
jgi:hypothetical protein